MSEAAPFAASPPIVGTQDSPARPDATTPASTSDCWSRRRLSLQAAHQRRTIDTGPAQTQSNPTERSHPPSPAGPFQGQDRIQDGRADAFGRNDRTPERPIDFSSERAVRTSARRPEAWHLIPSFFDLCRRSPPTSVSSPASAPGPASTFPCLDQAPRSADHSAEPTAGRAFPFHRGSDSSLAVDPFSQGSSAVTRPGLLSPHRTIEPSATAEGPWPLTPHL